MQNKYSIIPDINDIERTVALAKMYGASFEYNDFMMPEVYNDADEIKRRIEIYRGLDRDRSNDTMHGAFLGLDIAAADPEIQERSRDLMLQSVVIADRLGCRGVVFHTGLIGALRLEYYQENWLKNAVSFFSMLCSRYPQMNIYLENSFEQEPDIFVRLMNRMKTVSNFSLCLDYGHAYLTSTAVEEWFLQLHEYIGHMHLNDNDGKDDLHLSPGEGIIDFGRWKCLMEQYDIKAQVLLELSGYERQAAALKYMAELEKQLSLAEQKAVLRENLQYIEELNRQIWSFTEALTEAIDARTPYNGSHTRKVAEYAGLIADKINEMHAAGKEDMYFDQKHKDQLVMAALLHDIGKMIVPIEVMNKASRMENHMDQIRNRMTEIGLRLKVDMLEGKISQSDFELWTARIQDTLELTAFADNAENIDDDKHEAVKQLFDYEYTSPEGDISIPFLTEEEKECLEIRQGTLTEDERHIMESHVVMTERILSKVYFNKNFKDAPLWAAQHHEYLNGTGYPKGISGEALSVEARILAVVDICDALLATDRPYKKPMPKDKAFEILEGMAEEGKIDGRLVQYLKECI